MGNFGDTTIVLFILFMLFFIIYTKVKNQELKDTLDEIKAMVKKDI